MGGQGARPANCDLTRSFLILSRDPTLSSSRRTWKLSSLFRTTMSRSRWLYCFAACVVGSRGGGRRKEGGGRRKEGGDIFSIHMLNCCVWLLTTALTSSELEDGEMERRVQDSPFFILCSSSSVLSLSACTRERLSASWESSRSRCCSFLRPSSNSSSCVKRKNESHMTWYMNVCSQLHQQSTSGNNSQQAATTINKWQQQSTSGNNNQQVATNNQQAATTVNKRQQQSTSGNNNQQAATTINKRQQQSTSGNNSQQAATTTTTVNALPYMSWFTAGEPEYKANLNSREPA